MSAEVMKPHCLTSPPLPYVRACFQGPPPLRLGLERKVVPRPFYGKRGGGVGTVYCGAKKKNANPQT